MTGAAILFIIFILFPAAIGYATIMIKAFELSWNIKEYFRTRKEYMQKVIDNKENEDD